MNYHKVVYLKLDYQEVKKDGRLVITDMAIRHVKSARSGNFSGVAGSFEDLVTHDFVVNLDTGKVLKNRFGYTSNENKEK